jgi:hypothetical protein
MDGDSTLDIDNFQIDAEFDVFEKSEDKEKSRKICGYVSTETLDQQGEQLIQKGLDFSYFLEKGWFNDDHGKTTADILGYPEKINFVNGKGWYVEGYLLKGYKKADDIWELANALKKSGDTRKLGFSVQGKIINRAGNKVRKAFIRHVAITAWPVNPECKMEIIAKSFCNHSEEEDCIKCNNECIKALTAGYETDSAKATGGDAIREQSLEGGKKKKCNGDCKCLKNNMEGDINEDLDKKEIKRSLVIKKDLIKSLIERGYSDNDAEEIFKQLKLMEVSNEG